VDDEASDGKRFGITPDDVPVTFLYASAMLDGHCRSASDNEQAFFLRKAPVMKWRDVFAGSLVTLVITIVSGVAIYYLTREPKAEALAERLVYEIDAPISFSTDKTNLHLVTIRVKNAGGDAAKGTAIDVELNKATKILDTKLSLTSGPAGTLSPHLLKPYEAEVRIPLIGPNEVATVTILTDVITTDRPAVSVQSDKSVGKEGRISASSREPDVGDSKTKQVSSIAQIMIPLAFLAQIGVAAAYFVYRRQLNRTMRIFFVKPRDINNTAFIYLHWGLITEAERLLANGIDVEGASPLMLANYGLAVGLAGNTDRAQILLDAAEFWAEKNKREQAVIAFNKSILLINTGHVDDALVRLKHAFRLDQNEIRLYSTHSKIVAELRMKCAELHALLEEEGVHGQAAALGVGTAVPLQVETNPTSVVQPLIALPPTLREPSPPAEGRSRAKRPRS
jgi:hypothetical protein